jgi:hypothetical protein
LDGVESAVREAFEQRARDFASGAKVSAIEDIIISVIQKLNENGFANSQGF